MQDAARGVWRSGPQYSLCKMLGLASREGLWSTFEGNHSSLDGIREWIPAYRIAAWTAILATLGLNGPDLIATAEEIFMTAQNKAHAPIRGAVDTVRAISGGTRLGLLTNGRQFRLVYAGLDFESWCEWEADRWFDDGDGTEELNGLRQLLSPASLKPPKEGVSGLLDAVEEAEISARETTEKLRIVQMMTINAERIAADERVRGLEIARTRTIEAAEITAQQAIEAAKIVRDQTLAADRIAADRSTRSLEITRNQTIEEAGIAAREATEATSIAAVSRLLTNVFLI